MLMTSAGEEFSDTARLLQGGCRWVRGIIDAPGRYTLSRRWLTFAPAPLERSIGVSDLQVRVSEVTDLHWSSLGNSFTLRTSDAAHAFRGRGCVPLGRRLQHLLGLARDNYDDDEAVLFHTAATLLAGGLLDPDGCLELSEHAVRFRPNPRERLLGLDARMDLRLRDLDAVTFVGLRGDLELRTTLGRWRVRCGAATTLVAQIETLRGRGLGRRVCAQPCTCSDGSRAHKGVLVLDEGSLRFVPQLRWSLGDAQGAESLPTLGDMASIAAAGNDLHVRWSERSLSFRMKAPGEFIVQLTADCVDQLARDPTLDALGFVASEHTAKLSEITPDEREGAVVFPVVCEQPGRRVMRPWIAVVAEGIRLIPRRGDAAAARALGPGCVVDENTPTPSRATLALADGTWEVHLPGEGGIGDLLRARLASPRAPPRRAEVVGEASTASSNRRMVYRAVCVTDIAARLRVLGLPSARVSLRPGSPIEDHPSLAVGDAFNVDVMDVSDQGLGVRSAAPIPVGTEVSVEVDVVEVGTFSFVARVVHRRRRRGELAVFRHGLLVCEAQPAARAALRRWWVAVQRPPR
jgi:hypothetical protein